MNFFRIFSFLVVLTSLSVLVEDCFARARPVKDRPHEDLFGESEILVGFKVGPQLSGYTNIKTSTKTVSVQSSMRAALGGAIEFVYDLPRFEIDFFWNTRGGINNGLTYHSLAIPALVRIPYEIEPGVDIEFGLGYQVDIIFHGPDPYRTSPSGPLAAIGLLAEVSEGLAFQFESRYIFGLYTMDVSINGASPRDVQLLGGLLWHL
jgi:hypothetical protein